MNNENSKVVDHPLKSYIDSQVNEGIAKLGGSGGGGGMEARIARLEASVSHVEGDISEIKTDIRDLRDKGFNLFIITWGGIIASTLGLAYLLAKGFNWIQ